MPTNLNVPRTLTKQLDPRLTKKGQKRYQQPEEYSPTAINNELDYIHERLNQVVTEVAALTDLSGSASTADIIARVNALAEILRGAGLLRRE